MAFVDAIIPYNIILKTGEQSQSMTLSPYESDPDAAKAKLVTLAGQIGAASEGVPTAITRTISYDAAAVVPDDTPSRLPSMRFNFRVTSGSRAGDRLAVYLPYSQLGPGDKATLGGQIATALSGDQGNVAWVS